MIDEDKKEQLKILVNKAIRSIATTEKKSIDEIDKEFAGAVHVSVDTIRKHKAMTIKMGMRKDMIKWLSENAVKRGKMSKEWLSEFLEKSEYQQVNILMHKLFPENKTLISITNKSNLPSPTYTEFVGRIEELNKIKEGLKKQSAVVFIKSMGGNGKTSLALEAAKRSISKDEKYKDFTKFDSVIFISDKSNRGTINRSLIIEKILQVFGLNEVLKQSFESKESIVIQIMSGYKVLLIVDNYETITDQSIAQWLIDIPQGSKCIITSRRFYDEFKGKVFKIEVRGMGKEEARELIQNYAEKIVLGIDKIEVFDDLIKMVNGNPKAIEMALGIIKYERLTLENTIKDLLDLNGELFKDLFDWAWKLLDYNEKKILKIMSLFPNGTDENTLKFISEFQDNIFKSSCDKLINLSLLIASSKNSCSEYVYNLHPLGYKFAFLELENDSEKEKIQNKWMDFFRDFTFKVDHCYQDAETEDLKTLDVEWFKDSFSFVLDWAVEHKKYDFIVDVTDYTKYYFYIRGIWSSRYNLLRAEAAGKLSDIQTEFNAYVYHLNILCKQENYSEIKTYLPQAKNLKKMHKEKLSFESILDFEHVQALYHLLLKKDYETAIRIWTRIHLEANNPRQKNTFSKWLGTAHYKNNSNEIAKQYLLYSSEKINSGHNNISRHLRMAEIMQKQGDSEVEQYILDGLAKASDSKDNYHKAEFELLLGKQYLSEGKKSLAKDCLETAKKLFEKSGNNKKVEEVNLLIREDIRR